MYRALFLLLTLFLLAAGPKRPVIVSIKGTAPVEIVAGSKTDYPLELDILKGHHIQANPASQDYLIAVTVKFQEAEGVSIGVPAYPPGVPFRLKGSDKDISTYENKVLIKIPVEVDAGVKSGEIALKGTLRYQGCDATLCFPPVTMPIEAKLNVLKK